MTALTRASVNAARRREFAETAVRIRRDMDFLDGPASQSELTGNGDADSCGTQAIDVALLSELEKAHRLIQLLLNELTPAAKRRFIDKAERAGLAEDGATRFHERAAAIAKASALVSRETSSPRSRACTAARSVA